MITRFAPGPVLVPRGSGAVAPVRPHFLGADVFRGALARERKRADRSNDPVGLLLVEATGSPTAAAPAIWNAAADALAVVKREMDIAGWLDAPTRLGVIVPGIRAPELPEACRQFDARWRRELAKRLDAEAVGSLSTRLHVYPEPRPGGQEGSWPVDAVFYPDQERRGARQAVSDAIKRGLDIVGSVTLLGVLLPLLAVVAALVRVSSRGPILFRQIRIGHKARPFSMLKFRTMYTDSDQSLHREFVSSFIKAGGAEPPPGGNGFFKLTDDPRVTRVGRMLRSTSLDELPQLWNVLRGDMSLIGPRPPLPYELEQYAPWHRRRVLVAKPGITGLWQVAGRSRTTFEEMVRLDLRYAKTRSLWSDIKILLATPAAVISRKGAC